MVKYQKKENRIYVLDTNVILHDPASIFRFEEHTVFLPLTVLEELDNHKKGNTELARNARQAHRYLDNIISYVSIEQLVAEGVDLSKCGIGEHGRGRVRFQTFTNPSIDMTPDNRIIEAANTLMAQNEDSDTSVVLVTKDSNMRIKAAIRGIVSEDYQSDQVTSELTDADYVFTGQYEFESEDWGEDIKVIGTRNEGDRLFYDLESSEPLSWNVNMHICTPNGENFSGIVRSVEGNKAVVERTINYKGHSQVWGLSARNNEQNFALNALMDDNIDLVTILGEAGTGKTLLTLASGLSQVFDEKKYDEVIATRATIPVGEDIGFLPGEESDKMAPWMGAISDNLEFLASSSKQEKEVRDSGIEFVKNKVKLRSISFMRGRTFFRKFIIIDEAQNLTPKQIKTLITRAGPQTKIVCLGNLSQIDSPYLTESTSGLAYLVDKMKHWPYSAHITLQNVERSRLADFASEVL